MDEKSISEAKDEAKPKITRSRARHERRKRLISARRAVEQDSEIAPSQAKSEIDSSTISKSPERRSNVESVSKSKARRLRKKNKIEDKVNSTANSENNTGSGSLASQISESIQKTLCDNNVCTLETNSKSSDKDTEASGTDKIETNVSTKKTDPTKKILATEHELLENAKNLQLTESCRPTTAVLPKLMQPKSLKLSKIRKRESNFIITNNSPEIDVNFEPNVKSPRIVKSTKEEKIPSTSDKTIVDTNDDASLPNLVPAIPLASSKTITINETMSSDVKMNSQEKTREQIKAEREAKKAAKAMAKGKGKITKPETVEKNVEGSVDPKKIVEEARVDEVDGEIVAMTSHLTISGSTTKKSEIVVATNSTESKSKAELRAERRAKQEAQRAAKQGQISETNKPKSKQNSIVETTKTIVTAPTKVDDAAKKMVKRPIVKENAHEVNLFKHLYHEREQALIKVPTVNSNIHPAIVRLGVQYANKVIVGSNARCVALMAAVKQLIEDFERPSQADFTRGLETCLQESSAYLHHCRPLAVSMQNALRHLKWQMTQLHASTSDDEAKTKLGHAIDTYIQEQIQLADKAISITIQTKISNGDVILTYGFSSLINKILCDAYDAGRQFRVVVVDGRPWLEGREQLRRLAKHGLECSYVLINALSFIMPGVSKVFLGAHAILANGAVMSRVGTAQVALMAKAFNVPVLVACETHKTCERVQTDSIVYNEIADADELAQNLMGNSEKTSLINWRSKKSLNLLNLTYDVTPADLVTAVVTELAILPCTSVPVILRIKPSEI